ncbi:MAG: flippase-like domain-containing protein [Myxococcales bacterium]|nr:flippase-like domain-containing protein [Myxococcales bacterium]
MTRKRLAQATLALVVSGLLLWLVLSFVDAEVAWARVRAADPGWLLASLAVSFVVLWARGLRFAALTERAGPGVVTATVAAQNFLLRIMPLRVGELSLPYLLHRVAGEPPAHSLVSLVLVRVVDLWLLLVTGAVAVLMWFGEGDLRRNLALVGGVVVMTALLVGFRRWVALGLRFAAWGARVTGLERVALVQKVLDKLIAAVGESRRLRRAQVVALGGWSVVVAALQYVLFYCLLRVFGVVVHGTQVVVGAAAAQVAGALPVATVGSIGTHESGWVAGFVWVGMDVTDAALTGVGSQVITLAFAALFAGPAWWALRRARRAP